MGYVNFLDAARPKFETDLDAKGLPFWGVRLNRPSARIYGMGAPQAATGMGFPLRLRVCPGAASTTSNWTIDRRGFSADERMRASSARFDSERAVASEAASSKVAQALAKRWVCS